jgi:hypothetical protein
LIGNAYPSIKRPEKPSQCLGPKEKENRAFEYTQVLRTFHTTKPGHRCRRKRVVVQLDSCAAFWYHLVIIRDHLQSHRRRQQVWQVQASEARPGHCGDGRYLGKQALYLVPQPCDGVHRGG